MFYYRLIKKGGDIRELREKIGKNDNETMDFEQIGELIPGKTLQDIRFLSSKSIFGPITILDAERQKYYQFRLIGHEKLQNRPCTIIEAISKSENDSVSLSGKLWIDSENFSVLKININPKSIAGNNQLRDLSRDLNTKLSITLETEFYMLHENLRFPTRIHFKEAYKGGPIISIYKGTQSWERTETNITYNDYSFFNVEADVINPD